MAQNKNALIRYKTIDKCLQNRYRRWTLHDLIEACSDALYEYEGRDIAVSKRSIQLDIQMMRSDKLGYNAPIIVYDKKYYKYEDENYSITNIPLTDGDMKVLTEAVVMLKQFKDFSLFSDLGAVIKKLEDKVYSENSDQADIIYLDKNEHLKGLEYLDILYHAILKKITLTISYKSFKARNTGLISFSPYILKEYNNRWFVVGRKTGSKQIMTLAMDRIQKIDYNFKLEYKEDKTFDGEKYYENTIGVTVLNDAQLQEVHLKVDRLNAPYVLTKPFHHSQKVLESLEDGSVVIALKVHLNLEFERVILGFSDSIEVIKPRLLRNRIKQRFCKAIENYDSE